MFIHSSASPLSSQPCSSTGRPELLNPRYCLCGPPQLTKVHEEFWRGSLGEAAAEFARSGRARGEVTLLFAGAGEGRGGAAADGEGAEGAERSAAAAGAAPQQSVEEQLAALLAAGELPSNVRAPLTRLCCFVCVWPGHLFCACWKRQ